MMMATGGVPDAVATVLDWEAPPAHERVMALESRTWPTLMRWRAERQVALRPPLAAPGAALVNGTGDEEEEELEYFSPDDSSGQGEEDPRDGSVNRHCRVQGKWWDSYHRFQSHCPSPRHF